MITYLAVIGRLACVASVLRLLIAWRDYEKRWSYVAQPTRRERRTPRAT